MNHSVLRSLWLNEAVSFWHYWVTRKKEERPQHPVHCDFIQAVAEAVSIPVFAKWALAHYAPCQSLTLSASWDEWGNCIFSYWVCFALCKEFFWAAEFYTRRFIGKLSSVPLYFSLQWGLSWPGKKSRWHRSLPGSHKGVLRHAGTGRYVEPFHIPPPGDVVPGGGYGGLHPSCEFSSSCLSCLLCTVHHRVHHTGYVWSSVLKLCNTRCHPLWCSRTSVSRLSHELILMPWWSSLISLLLHFGDRWTVLIPTCCPCMVWSRFHLSGALVL